MKYKKLYLIIISIMLLSVLGLSIWITQQGGGEKTPEGTPVNTKTILIEGTMTPEPSSAPLEYIDISIISCGDIMYHMPQIRTALNTETGRYDFNDNMKYVKEFISNSDYAVCNLETTLAGTDGFTYSGYPRFNSPDAVLDSIKNAGFDMLLLSNNHTYDTGRFGMLRTRAKAAEAGFALIGTRDETSKSYRVKDINGVKVGFLNYSYESSDTKREDGILINGIFVKKEDAELIDTFKYAYKEEFYIEVSDRIAEMKNEGTDLIVMYIHWGNEYQLTENTHQKEMAQKLCDLGVDAIIGSHPHVIQPAEVLTNKENGKKTICFYSLGNFISNQNRKTLTNPSVPLSEYTENGVLAILNIRKIQGGEAYISKVEYIPTWVHRIDQGGSKLLYQILPLPYAYEHPDSYGLGQTAFGESHAKVTKERTDAALKSGVDEYNNWANNLLNNAA